MPIGQRHTVKRFTVDIPLLGGEPQSVAADATGTPEFAHTTVKLDTETLKHVKSAKCIVDYAWAATADGTIQVYDRTAGTVLGESSSKTGGESAEWEEFDLSTLPTAGNEICIRANITAAGASGETVTIYRVILRLVVEV